MKKFTYTITLLAFAFFFIGCDKEAMIEHPVVQENEMISIAKLTAQNDIQHLFLQKDMQASFLDNQGGELVFMEVVDDNKNGEEIGLLYRIYYKEQGVAVTTLIPSILTLKGGTYYYSPSDIATYNKVSCSTSDCTKHLTGCKPSWGSTCTSCPKKTQKCTRTVSNFCDEIELMSKIIRNAVAAY